MVFSVSRALGALFVAVAAVVPVPARAQDTFYATPPLRGSNGSIVTSGGVFNVVSGSVWQGVDVTGMAVDGRGNLYFGHVTYGPLRVELFTLPKGALVPTSLGVVVDSTSGLVSWNGFSIAASGGDVYYTTPSIMNSSGQLIASGSIQRLGGGPVLQGIGHPTGLAVDGSGNLYFGRVTYGPLRVELLKLERGATSPLSLGVVIDTSAGFVRWDGFSIAASPAGEVFYATPDIVGSNGTIVTPGAIWRLGDGPMLQGLGQPSGLAVNSAGSLYFGAVSYSPLRVRLFRLDRGATTPANLGTVVDTSSGFVSWNGFSIAARPVSFHEVINGNSLPILDFDCCGTGSIGARAEILSVRNTDTTPTIVTNYTVQEAARTGGYDHFNWLNTITHFYYNGQPRGAIAPFGLTSLGRPIGIDPLLGGNPFQLADYADPYWDEDPIPGRGSYHVRYGDNERYFRDSPNLIEAGWTADFQTSLIGVRADGTYDVLADTHPNSTNLTFRWRYLQTSNFSGGETSVLQNVDPDLAGRGAVQFLGFGGEPVTDQTPPTVSVPASVTIEASGPTGAKGTYEVSAIDTVDGTVPVTCTPQSGTLFSIGTTVVRCSASDMAGNRALETFLLTVADRTPPQVDCDPADGGWRSGNIALTCRASDIVGLAPETPATFSLTTDVAEGIETALAMSTSRSICDTAGNCAPAGPFGPFRIDRRVPVIAISSPGRDESYVVGTQVTISYACTDGGSGIAQCAGPVKSGEASIMGTVGTSSMAVHAADHVGNAVSSSVSFVVTYAVCSMFDEARPIHAGATVPIKVGLCDLDGRNLSSSTTELFAVGLFRESTDSSGSIQDAGNANPDQQFRFDLNLAGYVFNLKTTDLESGTYRLDFAVTGDPKLHSVRFKLR